MSTALVFHPDMSSCRFEVPHPFIPERFELAVALMEAWGLTDSTQPNAQPSPAVETAGRATVIVPAPCDPDVLRLAHSAEYIDAVQRASEGLLGIEEAARFGIGPGDTPAFHGMHTAAALAAGGTVTALDAVLAGRVQKAFNPAGGLHHAHRGHASGFCVYNDCAVAMSKATDEHPGLRIAYIDVDAHHGDGVEEAFVDRSDVLTVSAHESGSSSSPAPDGSRTRGAVRE